MPALECPVSMLQLQVGGYCISALDFLAPFRNVGCSVQRISEWISVLVLA
jgi:hypothetical protein